MEETEAGVQGRLAEENGGDDQPSEVFSQGPVGVRSCHGCFVIKIVASRVCHQLSLWLCPLSRGDTKARWNSIAGYLCSNYPFSTLSGMSRMDIGRLFMQIAFQTSFESTAKIVSSSSNKYICSGDLIIPIPLVLKECNLQIWDIRIVEKRIVATHLFDGICTRSSKFN